MSKIMINTNAYPISITSEKIKMRVVISVDMFEGTYHNPEDYINEMFRQNPYVQSAEIKAVAENGKFSAENDNVIGTRMISTIGTKSKMEKHAEIIFSIQMDSVPGSFHQPEDFMAFMTRHNYAVYAEQIAA